MSAGYTTCPECDAPAEIRRRFVLESTDGPNRTRNRRVRPVALVLAATLITGAHRETAG